MSQVTLMHLDISEESRVWIFFSKDPLIHVDEIKVEIEGFFKVWESHGKKVKGYYQLLDSHILVVAVDESTWRISGCGIDQLIHFVLNLQNKYKIQLMDRSGMLVQFEDKYVFYKIDELRKALKAGNLEASSLFLDSSISSFGSYKKGLFKELGKSVFAQL